MKDELSRRAALKLAAGCGVAALGSAGCTGTESATTTGATAPGQPTPSRRELAAVATVPDGAPVDVSTAAGEPAYLVRRGDSVRALSATCTHASCRVTWQADSQRFQCPCHHGAYDAQGVVISGPPPRALKELPVIVDAGTVYLVP